MWKIQCLVTFALFWITEPFHSFCHLPYRKPLLLEVLFTISTLFLYYWKKLFLWGTILTSILTLKFSVDVDSTDFVFLNSLPLLPLNMSCSWVVTVPLFRHRKQVQRRQASLAGEQQTNWKLSSSSFDFTTIDVLRTLSMPSDQMLLVL